MSYGGSNYQLPVGGFLPNMKNVQSGLSTDYTGANQLWNIGQPQPVYGRNKKGKRVQTGTRWSPLALQSQLPQYQEDVNQATAAIDQFAPNALASAQQAQQMGLTAADMASGAVPGLYNLGGMIGGQVPGMLNLGNTVSGYAPSVLGQAAGVTGQAGDVMASQLGMLPGLQADISQTLQTGFDPQNALFNRTAQQMRDVLGASGQAAGVGGSPYGANLASQGMENFLIDWQNQQLARQGQAAQTAGALEGTIGGLTAPGESLYNIGQGLYGTGANLAQAGAGIDATAAGLGQTAAGIDQSALQLGQGATQLASDAGNLPITTAEGIAQGKIGLQDALTQAKSNMYNQRTGGFNAMNQYLGTIDNFLKTAVGAQGQNLGASQTGLNNMLSAASLPLMMMGK